MDLTWALGGRALVVLSAVAVAASLVMFAGGASANCNCVIANGKIAFTATRDGNEEIYAMHADGSGQTRLTNNPAGDSEPAWSPSGMKIAFRSDRDGNAEIYAMNADGSGQTNLTNNPSADYEPDWSPSGTKIAFVSSRDGNDKREIYVMNANGSGQTRLTNDTEIDQKPAWSPDGKKIAFTRDDSVIWVMNADGSNQINLTNDPNYLQATDPSWSTDGTNRIVFRSLRYPDDDYDIWVMNADGSDPINLTNNSLLFDGDPAWSPDGKKIAYSRDNATNDLIQVAVMNADGSSQTGLTNTVWDAQPDWQRVYLAKPSSHLIPHTGVPDSIFKWKAGGFSAREPITMFFDGARIGVAEANPGGRLDAELTVPTSARPSEHTLEAVGRWSDVTVRDVFVVLPRAAEG
jgi:Tol biopolymer transport system component